METLLDCVGYGVGLAIFAINHIDTCEMSVIIPEEDDCFNYLGMTHSCFSIPVGGSEEITDDEGERHIITRLN